MNNKGLDYQKSQTVVKPEDDNKSDCYQMSPKMNNKAVSSTTSTNGKKRVMIRKFKYKNLTETQTPSDRSLLTNG